MCSGFHGTELHVRSRWRQARTRSLIGSRDQLDEVADLAIPLRYSSSGTAISPVKEVSLRNVDKHSSRFARLQVVLCNARPTVDGFIKGPLTRALIHYI